MAYAVVLYAHSWLRWVVLGLGLVTAVRAHRAASTGRPWLASDRKLSVAFVAALDTQVLLGLLLYFVLSPLTAAAFSQMKVAMKVAGLRFFLVEHLTAMLIAVAIAHVASVRAKRANDDRTRHKRIAWGVTLALLAIAAGIPWPGLPYARSLLRLP